ncbi:flagellar hook-length control protein FliK [Paludibacterium paludis]|uniref:Flagellar hook-length control protein-like C-terminal domain-containing protein n=1 Tax=Paludibacterium paludis TaxID=1225769 RepID=A0A918P0B6_9NEIS|nr:flagellar hook-length control protein FliK [Paludibacterium paludis]GGY11039.1 hypothetical protein GCM10011289_12370 [Paludibacterium paludis]
MTIPTLPGASVPSSVQGGAAMPGTFGSAADAAGGADSGLFAQLLGMRMITLGGVTGTSAKEGKDDGETTDAARPAKTREADKSAPALTDPLQIVALQQVKPEDAPIVPKTSRDEGVKEEAVESLTEQAPRHHSARTADDLQNLPGGKPVAATFLPVETHAAQTGKPQTALPVFSVPTPVSDPAWGRAVGSQVIAMANLKMDKASIEINPPQLGPIEVTLKLDDKSAQVVFTAASPATRDAIENSLPRLSQMLSAGGLQLTDAQVFSGQQEQRQAQSSRQDARQNRQEAPPSEDGLDALASIKAARNMLSIFA